MSKEYAFFIYLLERYAEYRQVSAQKVLAMELKNPVGGATHYHATSIKAPKWTRKKRVVAVIGNHVFYE